MSLENNELLPPAHPLPPGAQMPQLNLAGAEGFNVASGASIQSMPDPGKPLPYTPTLHGSPDWGGINPQAPIPSLNLAGVEGVPSPDQLMRQAPTSIHRPDYGESSRLPATLQSFDLAGPGINYVYGAEFAPDPTLPDLSGYTQPIGLDIQRNNVWAADPAIPDLTQYDVPDGLTIHRDPMDAEPLSPDLRNPQLTQDVHMSTRPGDLDPETMSMMHLSPTYQQIDDVPYNQAFIDQSGMNTTRRRHFDLMMRGLDSTA